MVQNNMVSCPESALASNKILRKVERHISCHCEWPAIEFIWAFFASYTFSHERYNINIYTQRTTKLLIPIIKSFVTLKVLIQNERTRCFTCGLYVVRLYKVLWELNSLPPLLLLWILSNMLYRIMRFLEYHNILIYWYVSHITTYVVM